MSASKTPIFEEFPTHGCDECERWWNNQCDGRKTHENVPNRPCKEFLPTRNIEIPQKIKTLENELKWLKWALLSLTIFIMSIIAVGGVAMYNA